MARTKQTARKVDQPAGQEGMEAAVLGQQQEEVPKVEDVAQEGTEEGAQKGAEEGEGVPPGDEVTGEQGPVDPAAQPAPSTSTAPAGSASTGTLSVVAYVIRRNEHNGDSSV